MSYNFNAIFKSKMLLNLPLFWNNLYVIVLSRMFMLYVQYAPLGFWFILRICLFYFCFVLFVLWNFVSMWCEHIIKGFFFFTFYLFILSKSMIFFYVLLWLIYKSSGKGKTSKTWIFLWAQYVNQRFKHCCSWSNPLNTSLMSPLEPLTNCRIFLL